MLTQEEVNELPDGTEIIVTWSGGNGPHTYILRQTEYGPHTEDHFLKEPMWKNGELSFVGKEKYHTKVRLAL